MKRRAVIAATLLAAGDGWLSEAQGAGMTDEQRAGAMAAAAAAKLGAPARPLGPAGDVSYGEFGFSVDKKERTLRARAFVMNLWTPLDGPDRRARFVNAAKLMDPPGPGTMFEHGGGHFFVDEKQAKLFLVKDYPIDMNPSAFAADVLNLVEIGAAWSSRWFARVMDIARGEAPPPAVPVTRANDRTR